VKHDCREHVEYRQQSFAENMDCEVDGAIARWWEEWWECTVCGEKYAERELEQLWREVTLH
jgi:hypothetical protein